MGFLDLLEHTIPAEQLAPRLPIEKNPKIQKSKNPKSKIQNDTNVLSPIVFCDHLS
jgi:hypothetical protein